MSANYEITYTVSQVADGCGDPCTRTFTSAAEAEEYAEQLEQDTLAWWRDEIVPDDRAEYEFNRSDDSEPYSAPECPVDVQTEIRVEVCGEEIEDDCGQRIAIALIDAMNAGNPQIRFGTGQLRPAHLLVNTGTDILERWRPAELVESNDAAEQFRRIGVPYPCTAERAQAQERARTRARCAVHNAYDSDGAKPLREAQERVRLAELALEAAQDAMRAAQTAEQTARTQRDASLARIA